jgi:hypothetical protein
MKRRPLYSQARISRDAERLAWLAQGLADSGSRVEDAYWEQEIRALAGKLLQGDHDEALNQALDRLYEVSSRAYDELADLVESMIEGGSVETPEGPRQLLLIAMPVLAWSHYAIPAGGLPAAVLANLKVQLAAHVLAAEVRVALADHLFSPDQLPHGYGETRAFAERLWRAVGQGRDEPVDGRRLEETGQYISDVRYLLAAVMVPPGRPVFRWNETDGNRDGALAQWRAQAGPCLQPVLAGCSLELLLPDAYFAAWRRADREGRAFSLQASVAYLQAALAVPAQALRAVVAPYYDQRLMEWRVGFAQAGNAGEVVHGVVWPLLGAEDDAVDAGNEIGGILKAAGVGEVILLDQRLPVEYCDDCGAPLFPTAEGESVHAEMPEPADSAPAHLH